MQFVLLALVCIFPLAFFALALEMHEM